MALSSPRRTQMAPVPKDTEWATSFTSGLQTIDAMNYTNLTFTNWTAAYNNSPGTTAVGLKCGCAPD